MSHKPAFLCQQEGCHHPILPNTPFCSAHQFRSQTPPQHWQPASFSLNDDADDELSDLLENTHFSPVGYASRPTTHFGNMLDSTLGNRNQKNINLKQKRSTSPIAAFQPPKLHLSPKRENVLHPPLILAKKLCPAVLFTESDEEQEMS
jgi:hypothetical protein